MARKLYGSYKYTCTQRVIATLLEKDINFEMVVVDLAKGEGQDPAHLLRHPLGKVPVLDDSGFVIYESRAICRYIEHEYTGKGACLGPSMENKKDVGVFEQAASLEQSYFDVAAGGIAFEKIYTFFTGGSTDQVKLDQHVKNLDRILSVYDRILSQQKFIATNEFTLVDIFHLPAVKQLKDLGYGECFDGYPHVKRWTEILESRESWKRIIAAQA